MEVNKYTFIIVVAPNDCRTLEYALPFIKQHLPIKNIKIIGNQKVYTILEKDEIWKKNSYVEYIDEDSIIRFCDVQRVIKSISDDKESIQRTGLQQFLKMKYALYCEDEYYVVWDADTIPLRKMDFFKGNKPVFDMKDEYNQAYFDTMSRLVSGLCKIDPHSFIAEHMIIHSKSMIHLINEIEKSKTQGEEFWEKILYSITPGDIKYSGFSEFETYGTYCMIYYPDFYEKRMYDSFRFAARYFVLDEMGEHDFEWIARDYPAVSFEKMMIPDRYYRLFSSRFVQVHFHIKAIFEFQDNVERFYKRVRNKVKKWIGKI